MNDLVEFLLARLADDEREALVWRPFGDEPGEMDYRWQKVPTYTPARVVAEVDAKRRIVFLAKRLPELLAGFERFDNNRDAWAEVLKRLALPYATHPDYDERWRP